MSAPVPLVSSSVGPKEICILCNPRSGRVKKQIHKIRSLVAKQPHLVYYEASTLEEFKAFFVEHSLSEDSLLIVIAGDGTFHAVLTLLFSSVENITSPVIYLIAGGTTNMTAADFGITKRPYQNLQSLLQHLSGLDDFKNMSVQKEYLKVHNGGQVLCGMFLGSGLIAQGVKYYQDKLSSMGVTGEILPGLVFLRFLVSWLFRHSDTKLANSGMVVKVNNKEKFQGSASLTLVTVLRRLLLGCTPYWGEHSGSIKLTNVVEKPKALFYSFTAVMRGRGDNLDPDNYMSFSAKNVTLDFNGHFIIDGELYFAESGLSISTGEFRLLSYD